MTQTAGQTGAPSGTVAASGYWGNGARLALMMMSLMVGSLMVWGPQPSRAAELVMFESAACPWCLRWHADLGAIYPKTAESRIAPLRRVDLGDPRPDDLSGVRSVTFTPTFVLMHDGTEVGRITGYGGDEFFWFQLDTLLKKLPKDSLTERL